MPKPPDKRDLQALIKATEENGANLKKMRQKMEQLDAAIMAAKKSRLNRNQSERNPN
ncbi:MAG: hypothetical protein ACREE6_16745 [Limisphaerales bacterium]